MPASTPSSTFYTALRGWLPWLVGVLAISLAIGLTVNWILRDSTPGFSTQVHTSRTGTRKLKLPEGSEVMLNRDTALAIAYFSRRRDVTFVHGEALFKVRWQYRTTFTVRTDTEEVTIVGTQVEGPDIVFTVRSDLNTLLVQVKSGHLKVLTPTAGPREFVEMQTGDALQVLRAKRRHVLTRVDPATIANWVPQ